MKLVCPYGVQILGTLYHIPATTIIDHETVSRKKDGTFAFEFAGGSKIDWDGQETVVRNGFRVFVDEEGNTWTEDQLRLIE